MAAVRGKLSKLDLFRVFWRLLFMQGLINRRGMQNIAFAGAIGEIVGKLAGSKDNSIMKRHLGFFNCNPNFVPLIVGGVLRLEEQRLEGEAIGDHDIEQFKTRLASPLAAMGDMLFLGNLKPLALTFACIFAIYKIPIGLLVVFLLYNLAILSCRAWGIYFGYAKGWELVDFFSGPGFQRILAIIQGLGAGVGGILVGIVFHRFPQGGSWLLPIAAVLTVMTLYVLKKDLPASWLAVILFPATALITLLLG